MIRRLMNMPRSVDLVITNECNLRCQYCYHFESPGDVGRDLPLSAWLQFFHELTESAVTEVTIAGGEPFFRSDFREIIDGIVKNRMRFGVLSNGTLISNEIAAYLASTKRCNSVQVSIDGGSPKTHDSFRGQGNFYKALKGIKNLQKNKIKVAVRVTIHRQNVHDLGAIAELLLEEIGLPGFSTNSAHYMGLCAKNTKMVQLTTEEQFIAMKKLMELNRKYNNRIGAAAGPLANAKAWMEMEEARQQAKESIPGRGKLVSCGGVFAKLAVRADGVIVPCNQMSHIELGKINKDSLKDLWHNSPQLKNLRERRDLPLSEFDFCKGCGYIDYCTGGCPAMAYAINGNEYHPSTDSCLKRYLENGGQLPHQDAI
ncbi:MAG: SynChlorMet cassette radical SAM/SPASM protein ScmE [bacterium]